MQKSAIVRIVSGLLILLLVPLAVGSQDCRKELFEFFEKVEVTKPADIGTVTLDIETKEESFKAAIEENEKLRKALITEIVKKGIAEDNVKSANYSSIPVSGFFTGKTKKHKVNNRIDVTIGNEKELAKVAGIVDSKDNVEYVGITFSLKNEDSLMAVLRKQAFEKVQERQKEIEGSFGVKLELFGYREVNGDTPQFFERGLQKSIGYDVLREQAALPETAFNSLKMDMGIIFQFRIKDK
jgi:uncharacterized protein YggE